MSMISNLWQRIKNMSLFKKLLLLLVVGAIGWFAYTKSSQTNSSKTEYQTDKVTRGTVTVSVSASGSITSVNSASVSTSASGVVNKVYVKDGETVKQGDKIAELELDMVGKQRESQALASYQSAKNALDSARANLYSSQSDMFTNWDKFYTLATTSKYQNGDGTPNTNNRTLPEFNISQDDWLASEAKYKNQQNVVNQAQISLGASWISYQQSSKIIYAPISGTITGLTLQEGSIISQQSNSSSTTTTTADVASIITKASPTVKVNLTEIDIPKISLGNAVTLTSDAFPNKTFTGQIVSINKIGTVSSGVTNYPVIIKLDTEANYLLPNMAVNATIITQTKNNVLKVAQTAVQENENGTYVRVIKNGQPTNVSVETGISSDTETEIISGLSEGETVVTGVTQTATTNSSQSSSSQSPFSPFGNTRIRTGGTATGGTRRN